VIVRSDEFFQTAKKTFVLKRGGSGGDGRQIGKKKSPDDFCVCVSFKVNNVVVGNDGSVRRGK